MEVRFTQSFPPPSAQLVLVSADRRDGAGPVDGSFLLTFGHSSLPQRRQRSRLSAALVGIICCNKSACQDLHFHSPLFPLPSFLPPSD